MRPPKTAYQGFKVREIYKHPHASTSFYKIGFIFSFQCFSVSAFNSKTLASRHTRPMTPGLSTLDSGPWTLD